MKKSTVIILVVIVVAILSMVGVYNSMVSSREEVNGAWAEVENQYQRRSDLIPNLVSTVQGYAAHESQTLQDVINARSRATSITLDPDNMTQEALDQFNQAQGQLGSSLNRMLLLREAYPDLKANQNFLELQAEVAGTENRIGVARMRFNEKAQAYNAAILRFPKNLFASMFGFHQRPYFKSTEGADVAPVIDFN